MLFTIVAYICTHRRPIYEKNIRILLIEDDNDDVELLQDALKDHNVTYVMHVINDGSLVLPYVESCTMLPDIVVLDFNLPKVHGKELLKLFKSYDTFARIPVVILTTSSSKDDIDYSMANGATEFITKPTSLDEINNMVSAIIDKVLV